MRLFAVEFDKEYVNEAWYILPFLVYSDEANRGKTLWIGWLKWLIGIQFKEGEN